MIKNLFGDIQNHSKIACVVLSAREVICEPKDRFINFYSDFFGSFIYYFHRMLAFLFFWVKEKKQFVSEIEQIFSWISLIIRC